MKLVGRGHTLVTVARSSTPAKQSVKYRITADDGCVVTGGCAISRSCYSNYSDKSWRCSRVCRGTFRIQFDDLGCVVVFELDAERNGGSENWFDCVRLVGSGWKFYAKRSRVLICMGLR